MIIALKDSDVIQRWDLWFDEGLGWRAVSDDWVGKKTKEYYHVFIRSVSGSEGDK